MSDLQKENEHLKRQIENLKKRLHIKEAVVIPFCLSSQQQRTGSHEEKPQEFDDSQFISIIVLGASGDLAKKKTFPSLFALYNLKLLPKNFGIFGFARSKMSDEEFHKHLSQQFVFLPIHSV